MNSIKTLRNLLGKTIVVGVWEYVCPKCHLAKVSIDMCTTTCDKCGGVIRFPHFIELTIQRNKVIKAEGIY